MQIVETETFINNTFYTYFYLHLILPLFCAIARPILVLNTSAVGSLLILEKGLNKNFSSDSLFPIHESINSVQTFLSSFFTFTLMSLHCQEIFIEFEIYGLINFEIYFPSENKAAVFIRAKCE